MHGNVNSAFDFLKKPTNQFVRLDGKQPMFPRITGRQYLTSWIFGTGCTTLTRVIALSQANYRLDLSVRVSPLSV